MADFNVQALCLIETWLRMKGLSYSWISTACETHMVTSTRGMKGDKARSCARATREYNTKGTSLHKTPCVQKGHAAFLQQVEEIKIKTEIVKYFVLKYLVDFSFSL